MCTFEQKEKIKKLALEKLTPKEIQTAMLKQYPDFDWDNKKISDYIKKTAKVGNSKISKISEKIAEKTEEKLIDKIAEKKATAYAAYTVDIAWEEFEEVRKLALCPRGDDGRIDLSNANKAIENKSKIRGLFEADNKQKAADTLSIQVVTSQNKGE